VRSVRELTTSVGPERATILGRSAPVTVVLGHGAGGGIDSADLQAVSAALVSAGHRVVLVEHPWRVAGRRVAPRPATLDAAWLQVITRLRLRRRGARSSPGPEFPFWWFRGSVTPSAQPPTWPPPHRAPS
jgi:hypothetical protein